MKKYNNYKYIGLFLASLAIASCDNKDPYEPIEEPTVPTVSLNANGLNFSKYVSVGASFTAGFTDNALFIAGQENSFPNILAKKFAMAKGGDFTQPLMKDNVGGIINNLDNNKLIQAPRLYFNGSGPAVLKAMPSTTLTPSVTTTGNFGVPGAKSFHLLAKGYGNPQGVALGLANPYYARFASSPTASIIEDVMVQQPTFFSLSEIGGNDVLGYALSGGTGKNQKGNTDPTTYGNADITDPNVFAHAFSTLVSTLTTNPETKGVVGTLPYITSLAHFTTVPHNPLDPTTNAKFASQVQTLNGVFGMLNKVYNALGYKDRTIVFSETKASPVVIEDEDLEDISMKVTQALLASGDAFTMFVKGFGLPAEAAPKVAGLLGQFYGQTRQATSKDLFVLPSSAVIGKVDKTAVAYLMTNGNLSKELAGQFSIEGITKPLEDKWVLTPQEQKEIKTATDAYNETIKLVVKGNDRLALVDLAFILDTAAKKGVQFDGYNLTTNLVTGGLISLDGVHLTGRGYALMANEMLKAIDAKFGSNFAEATNGLAKADDYPTNYSPTLK